MVVQASVFEGVDIIYIWLSKQERDNPVINDIISSLKAKYRVCTFFSGTTPTKEYVRKIILDNI